MPLLGKRSAQKPKEASPKKCKSEEPSLAGELGPADVLLGRGKGSYESQGNVQYQQIICCYLPGYMAAKKKQDKTRMTHEIVAHVKHMGGRFLQKARGGKLVEISDKDARDKVAQALRHRRREYEKESGIKESPFSMFKGGASAAAMEFSRYREDPLSSTRTDDTEPVVSGRSNYTDERRLDDYDFDLEDIDVGNLMGAGSLMGASNNVALLPHDDLDDLVGSIGSVDLNDLPTSDICGSDISSEFSLLDLNSEDGNILSAAM